MATLASTASATDSTLDLSTKITDEVIIKSITNKASLFGTKEQKKTLFEELLSNAVNFRREIDIKLDNAPKNFKVATLQAFDAAFATIQDIMLASTRNSTALDYSKAYFVAAKVASNLVTSQFIA